MKCNSRIITEPSSFSLPFGFGSRWLICLWLAIGSVCLTLDSQIQPVMREWGQTPVVAWIAHAWCELGATFGISAFLLVGLIASWRTRDITFIKFLASICLAGLIAQAIKHGFGRARPNEFLSNTQFFGPLAWFRVEPDIRIDSFPSGHTAAAFAMAMSLSLRWPRFRWLWFGLASGVGLARVLTNSHYTSDVVFGSLVGTFVAYGTNNVLQHWPSRVDLPAVENESRNERLPEHATL